MSFTCLTPIFAHGRKLPCGKCGNCIRKRSLEWSFRLMQESKAWSSTSFITLTYDEENVPCHGVDKEVITKFLKKLRHLCDFKYYLVSEYGPSTLRPHYHALFFHDLQPDFFLKHVEQCWQNGIVTIGDVTQGRVMYCANYHITKTFYPSGKNENFVHMSKGLGKNWLTDKRLDFFRESGQMFANHYDGYRVPLPRYYKDKILFSPEQVAKNHEFIKKQSLIDNNKSLYKLIKIEEKINKTIKKKLKGRSL